MVSESISAVETAVTVEMELCQKSSGHCSSRAVLVREATQAT